MDALGIARAPCDCYADLACTTCWKLLVYMASLYRKEVFLARYAFVFDANDGQSSGGNLHLTIIRCCARFERN